MQVAIASKFRGPPQSGNGGYTCGLLASALRGAVEVTLRRPPPLDVPLTIVVEGEHASLRDGESDIALATAIPLALDVPEPPDHDAAVEAARHYPGFHAHPYPGCFVCGPAREQDDGLRIFPGRVAGRELVAAPFTPSRALGEPIIEQAIVWAALDCPGYFGATLGSDQAAPLLLGKMHAEVLHPVRTGVPHVVIGWSLGREGRKVYGATALFDDTSRLVAKSRQVWIAPKPA